MPKHLDHKVAKFFLALRSVVAAPDRERRRVAESNATGSLPAIALLVRPAARRKAEAPAGGIAPGRPDRLPRDPQTINA